MRILTDIGGTHVRFCVLEGDGAAARPAQIKKYRADSFHTFEEAFFVYCKEFKIDKPSHLAIATAGYPDRQAGEVVWRFVNSNPWVINPAAFTKSNITVDLIMNDFEAATWGLVDMPADQRRTLREGKPVSDDFNLCLLGPGTGLGLGYLVRLEGGDFHVQRTHGGHTMAAPMSDEHVAVMKTLSRIKDGSGIIVYENLASGPGLFMLYRAQCLMAGQHEEFGDTRDIVENLDQPHAADALRLFHEFLGLFAHSAVVNGHAYGGLYLTGGVLDRLMEKDLFDFVHFETFLNLKGAHSVMRDVANMPVHYVSNPYLSMHGLRAALGAKGLL